MPDEVENVGDPLATTQVHATSLRLPEFWRSNPQLWFLRLEAQFRSHKIISDATKFDAVVGTLECEILSDVTDLVLQPPPTNKYDALKQRLISLYSDSETKRIQKLLSGLSLGDAKPSQLLQKMVNLNCNKVDETVLRTLWFEQLPANMRAILSASSETLTSLAGVADKIHDTIHGFGVSVAETSQPLSEIAILRLEVAELKALIKGSSYSQQRRRFRSKSHSRNESRLNSSTSREATPGKKFCWYHFRFGNAAKKCTSPCDYTATEN